MAPSVSIHSVRVKPSECAARACSRQGHTRREAGSQSQGSPEEIAQLPEIAVFRNHRSRLTGVLTILTLLVSLAAGPVAAPAAAKAHAKRTHSHRCVRARHVHGRRHRKARRCLRNAHRTRSAGVRATSAQPAAARAAATVAAGATTAHATSSSPGGSNPFGPAMFGVATGGAIATDQPATLARDLGDDQTVGARWIRTDVNWASVQQNGASAYDWTATDAVIRGALARGMQVLATIVYTPVWARPAGTSPTYAPDPSAYATFAAAAARHYAAFGVHAFEIWNEENQVNAWTPAPSAPAYAALLKLAYPAIKAADPSATVVTGGLSPTSSDGTNIAPVDFLQAVYAAGGEGSFDAVGMHPYCWPAMPGDAADWSAWYQMYGTSRSLRSVMVAAGDGNLKIWATEYGAPTNGPAGTYVSQATQAAMISRAFQVWSGYSWAGPLFVYQGRDQGTDTASYDNFFGFLNYDGTPKPAFAAYQQAVATY
jgi:hypothetical protein